MLRVPYQAKFSVHVFLEKLSHHFVVQMGLREKVLISSTCELSALFPFSFKLWNFDVACRFLMQRFAVRASAGCQCCCRVT